MARIRIADSQVMVAGAGSLVGSALARILQYVGCRKIISPPPGDCDFTSGADVRRLFEKERPDVVICVAGKSGGIEANRKYPADLMLDNLLAAANLLKEAHRFGVSKLLYLAASCVYPKDCPQPMRPESIWTGPMETTSLGYSTAKLAGMVLASLFVRQYGSPFIVGIPADIYGPMQSVDAENAHVIPSVMAKMHQAKVLREPEVTLWGTGQPIREFLYADDLARACVQVIEEYDSPEPINLGGGAQLTIRQAVEAVALAVGYTGKIKFDVSRPDGSPRKTLDSSVLLGLGWRPSVSFSEGLDRLYQQTFLGAGATPA